MAAAGSSDKRDNFKGLDGLARDIDTLGVGAGVRRGEQQARAADQGEIVGGEAFELVAVGEGEAEPEAGGAGTDGKTLVEEPLGVGLVAGIGGEVADITDPLDLVPGNAEELAGGVEDLQLRRIAVEVGAGVTGMPVAGELAHDDGLAEGGHRSGLSHDGGGKEGANETGSEGCAYYSTHQALANCPQLC